MVQSLLTKIFGTKHERDIRRMTPLVQAINQLEPEVQPLADAELLARYQQLRAQVEERLRPVLEDEQRTLAEADADPLRRQTLRETLARKRRQAEEEILREVLVPVFALVREVGRRHVAMRPFDVQLLGGVVLHEGKIAEMKTGEGKTLVATLPACLNALLGKGVHIVTVNDYLAKRDAEWMGPIYKALGLNVGVIVHGRSDAERKAAYRADITYGTNNEFGFDYLRDNMKFDLGDCVQRPHYFAIVDEVDSILIDEARTPLIISGPSEESTDKYYRIDRLIPKLQPEADFSLDEKHRSVALTEEGVAHVERLLGLDNLYDPIHLETLHHVQQGLRAHALFKRDRDYIVKDGEVLIIDEFTGRQMPGRRWSDGLHQAIEAKEGVKIERENQTLATITFQNYFRMYDKLAGMTGTAETEAAEFSKIYNLDVVVIPTNCPLLRHEFSDVVYRTEREKFGAVIEEIRQLHAKGQPVLVGTISIEKSEALAELLKRAGIPHHVLNAKQHEREAYIVAQAGRRGTLTISTNMAGRGTDILLGGNPEFMTKDHLVKQNRAEPLPPGEERYGSDEQFIYFYYQEQFWRVPKPDWQQTFAEFKAQCDREHDEVVGVDGLHILGTERHEARRIDNQLRGRAGRQGDPGSSRFYLSLEDDLMRIFGGERIKGLMLKLGMEEGVPIESRLITRRIEAAQKAVEAQNFEARKHLLEYDDVMNKQRVAIYSMRRTILEGADLKEEILSMAADFSHHILATHCPPTAHPEHWNLDALRQELWRQFGLDTRGNGLDPLRLNRDELEAALEEKVKALYGEKERQLGAETLRRLERIIRLQIIDTQWKDHLLTMDHLKEGINLRGYGQKDPLIEYKRESFGLFEEMLDRVDSETLRYLFLMKPVQQEMSEEERLFARRRQRQASELQFLGGGAPESARPQPIRAAQKIGRNDPCPCGSGKKYKKCHGAVA
ncbi:MAG: preprotein translocase subunit SecA [Acidobacteria bacterium]|nr:preprotein translocase subunit SecA [Acidobacteriota bacterium]